MANAPNGTHQNDVTCPSPANTFTEDLIAHKHARFVEALGGGGPE